MSAIFADDTTFFTCDEDLKVHYCRFENQHISSSPFENNMLKISH